MPLEFVARVSGDNNNRNNNIKTPLLSLSLPVRDGNCRLSKRLHFFFLANLMLVSFLPAAERRDPDDACTICARDAVAVPV